MRDNEASNCSVSAISHSKKHWEWDVHTKPPKEFGNFLPPSYNTVFKTSNTPCDCTCEKCVGYNRHLLNDGKIKKIKKRINKMFQKIQEDENDFNKHHFNGISSNSPNSKRVNGTEQEQNDMSHINNLCWLKLVAQASGFIHNRSNVKE